MLTKGAYSTSPEYKDKLYEIGCEAFWRLGQFENLDTLLHEPELRTNNSWNVQIGRSLLCMKDGTFIVPTIHDGGLRSNLQVCNSFQESKMNFETS